MAEVKVMPELRFPEFKGKWNERRFEELYSFKRTNSYSRDKLNYENGVVKNIHYGDIHTQFNSLFDVTKENVPFINEDIDTSKIEEDSYLKDGDLVIADASEDYNDIGKTIEVVSVNDERVVAGLHTFLARRESEEIIIGFVSFLLKTRALRVEIMRIAQGTKVLGLAMHRFAKIPLFIPRPKEQQKIASFLTAIDERIQLLRKKKTKLEDYKKGVMQQIFSQRIRFKDENGQDFPDWEEKKLGELGVFVGGGTPDSSIERYWQGTIPWISSSDIYEDSIHLLNKTRYITKEAILKSATKKVPKGSVLMVSRVGIGKFAVADSELCTSQDFTALISSQNEYFLAYYFKARANRFISLSQGTSIKGFTTKDIKSAKFLIPLTDEQQKIASFLTSLDNSIERHTKEIEASLVYKKGLLQKMFV